MRCVCIVVAAVEVMAAGVDVQDGAGEGGGDEGDVRGGGEPGGGVQGVLQGEALLGGDAVGYLDVTLGAVIGFVRVGEALHGMRLFAASRSPLLDAWLARFSALDAAKAVLPDTGRLAEYAKMKQAEWAAAATN